MTLSKYYYYGMGEDIVKNVRKSLTFTSSCIIFSSEYFQEKPCRDFWFGF